MHLANVIMERNVVIEVLLAEVAPRMGQDLRPMSSARVSPFDMHP